MQVFFFCQKTQQIPVFSDNTWVLEGDIYIYIYIHIHIYIYICITCLGFGYARHGPRPPGFSPGQEFQLSDFDQQAPLDHAVDLERKALLLGSLRGESAAPWTGQHVGIRSPEFREVREIQVQPRALSHPFLGGVKMGPPAKGPFSGEGTKILQLEALSHRFFFGGRELK